MARRKIPIAPYLKPQPTKHISLGPWRVEAEENNEYYTIISADGHIVAVIEDGYILELEANAYLIGAAPQTLEALEGALKCINELTHNMGSYQTAWVSKYTAPIRAAIEASKPK